MVRVLHVISLLEVGGAQRLVSDMLPVMAAQGAEVSVLVNRRMNNFLERKLEDAGVRILSLDVEDYHRPMFLWRFVRMLRGYDVVHVHLFPYLYYGAFASLFLKCRFVYTEHSTNNRRRSHRCLRWIEQMAYRQYDRVVSISDKVQDSLMRWLGANRNDSRFVVVSNGVDLHGFDVVKRESGYPVTLLMVSRFTAAKDQATVVRAMGLLDERYHVVFVGDGPTRQGCEALAASLAVGDRCHFVGEQSDIPSWIAKADIGVQSSVWEGFGLSAVELMAGGLPVIVSDIKGLRQVVENAGVVVPQGDAQALADEVIRLMGDKGCYQETVERCRRRAQDYSIEKTALAYLEVYERMI